MTTENDSFELESVEAWQDKLRDEINVVRYWLSMGVEKIWAILGQHKKNMHQKIIESLEQGWRTWSTHWQVEALKSFRADQENQ